MDEVVAACNFQDFVLVFTKSGRVFRIWLTEKGFSYEVLFDMRMPHL